MKAPPLIVDLDGTLIKTDLLVEVLFIFVRKNLLKLLTLSVWFLSGKIVLKKELASVVDIDPQTLPYFWSVIDFIKAERQKGREIILATASHQKYAHAIANHLQLFDCVMATDSTVNLSAKNKRDRLVCEYGDKGFDYIGNSKDDLIVWASARHAYIANPQFGVERRAKKNGNVKDVFISEANAIKVWFKALRIHQWVKNLLIFVPLLASHQIQNFTQVAHGLLAFVLFGICASSVYILNDLLDISDDRYHSTKKYRAFASGAIPIIVGIFIFPLLLISAFLGALLLLPIKFTFALFVYYVLTVLYSFVLKRMMVIDVIILASLYTMRIIAGTFAFNVDLTFWMLAFSMFIFLSLALVKRFAELHEARADGKMGKARGRGYFPDDLEMISSLGASSGYLSVMVLALYIQDESTVVLYRHPKIIWLACPLLLFWISRTWLLAHRGRMHDDPVVFAIKDKTSLLIGALFGLTFWFAI